MNFNSYIFVLCYLPIVVCLWYQLNKLADSRYAKLMLVIASLVFYGFNNPSYVFLIVGSTVVNYFVYLCMRKGKPERRKTWLSIGIVLDVGILFYFKYFDFFIENFNYILDTDFSLKNLILPLGISFYTFQQIGFLTDCYRGEVEDLPFIDYCLFVTFFPQLVAGPIVEYNEMLPQFNDVLRKRINWNNIGMGLYIFTMGLAKKVLLADTFGNVVNAGVSVTAGMSCGDAVLVMLSYTFQIYFDFSGYCDMAIGIAKMLNIDLPVNFDSPYKSLDNIDFWNRWHITLSRFLTKNLYIPLGGNRKGTVRTYVNVMIVFLISGLWHGAAWTFVLWGLLHGCANVVTRICRNKFSGKKVKGWIKVPLWNINFIFINISWLLFRSDSVKQFWEILKAALSLSNIRPSSAIYSKFGSDEIITLFKLIHLQDKPGVYGIYMLFYIVLSGIICLFMKNLHEEKKAFRWTWGKCISTAILLWLCVVSFSSLSTFLYFNF